MWIKRSYLEKLEDDIKIATRCLQKLCTHNKGFNYYKNINYPGHFVYIKECRVCGKHFRLGYNEYFDGKRSQEISDCENKIAKLKKEGEE